MENKMFFDFDYSTGSPDCEFPEFNASFSEFTIDVNGMVNDLCDSNKRDTESIRNDFIHNGIDSAIGTQIPEVSQQLPPGCGTTKQPLAYLENQIHTDKQSPLHCKTNLTKTESEFDSLSSRRKRSTKENSYCVFCYNNREEKEMYLSHLCRDEAGIVVCPKLRNYRCPYCQATGNNAHTKKYCPKKPIITPDDLQAMVSPFIGQHVPRRNRNTQDRKTLRF